MSKHSIELSRQISLILLSKKLFLTTAESCTGGGIAHLLTEIPGSSTWYERGFVTYSNSSKEELLNVPADILMNYGAVSRETAQAMAEGALQNSHAQVSIAVTGIAGPDGGTSEKPVGTVWFSWARIGKSTETLLKYFKGDRAKIRNQAIEFALQELLNLLQ
jgi:nicotinamide-nucleotide amidase